MWLEDFMDDLTDKLLERLIAEEKLVCTALDGAVDTREGQYTPVGIPVDVWVGFSDVSQGRGRELLEKLIAAGVRRYGLTPVNDAGAGGRWKWQGNRQRHVRNARAIKDLGGVVVLGPWAWCIPEFMDRMGQELLSLTEEVGGVEAWELDAEGIDGKRGWGLTCRRLARQKHRNDLDGAVAEAMGKLVPYAERAGVHLEQTSLYWDDPTWRALARHPAIRALTLQSYSVWFRDGSAKAKATHAPNYQPGVLQERTWREWEGVKQEYDLDAVGLGAGWWAQDRRGAPPPLNISKPEAFRRASEAALKLGADHVCGWAMHLWDGAAANEAARVPLVLSEIAYLTSGGVREEATPQKAHGELPPPPEKTVQGATVHWDKRFIAGGERIPSGYRKIDWDDDPRGTITQAATLVRSMNHATIRPLDGNGPGTYTPFSTPDGDRYVALDERHGATFRGGKRVKVPPPGIHGVTVFEHVSNRKGAS